MHLQTSCRICAVINPAPLSKSAILENQLQSPLDLTSGRCDDSLRVIIDSLWCNKLHSGMSECRSSYTDDVKLTFRPNFKRCVEHSAMSEWRSSYIDDVKLTFRTNF